MKNMFLLFLSMSLVPSAMAQLKVKEKCPDFEVNILDGMVNGIKPDLPHDRIKILLPCFTSAAEEKDNSKCGSSVFFKDRDIYFYTQRDYIEIGPKFKGKLSLPLLGAPRTSLFKWLGNPTMNDDKWSAYKTSYGVLVLHFDTSNKVNLIQFSTKGTEGLSLCE
jgi:hypothetical protein